MLRNNDFPNPETKIKKYFFGEARDLSESFGIFEIVRVVFSQSPVPKKKKSAFSGPEKKDLIGYRYKPFKKVHSYTVLNFHGKNFRKS